MTIENRHKLLISKYIDVLIARLELLRKSEKALLEAYLQDDVSLRNLAELTKTPVSTISRQIRQLSQRLLHGDYIYVIRNRSRFNEHELKIAYDHYILGQGYRRIARSRRLSEFTVRRQLARLKLEIAAAKRNMTEQSVGKKRV